MNAAEVMAKGRITLWIIWGAMVMSLLIYVLICHLAVKGISETASPGIPLDLLRRILYLVAVGTAFLTHVVRRRMLAKNPAENAMKDLSSLAKPFPNPLARYTTVMIVSLAFSESIGVYGLVLFLLGDDFQTLYTFIGISALCMYIYRPRATELETTTGKMPEDGMNV